MPKSGAFTKDQGKGGSERAGDSPPIPHLERLLAPRRGCGRRETPNRSTPEGESRNSIPLVCTRRPQVRTRDTSGDARICRDRSSLNLSKPDGLRIVSE